MNNEPALPPVPSRTARLEALRRFASTYGALTVSTCSLMVAVCAFILTIVVQNRDFEYKEMSIKPILQFHTTRDLQFKLINSGLGPAHIRNGHSSSMVSVTNLKRICRLPISRR